MALPTPTLIRKCPKCGSRDVIVEYRSIDSSKSSVIRRKYIKCNSCGHEG